MKPGPKKGFKRSLQNRINLSISKMGNKNPMWKEVVNYRSLHTWVQRNKKQMGICESCNLERRTEWANISGEYLRDLNDFRELCRSCHAKSDNRYLHFGRYTVKE